jgi:hypothetical protein
MNKLFASVALAACLFTTLPAMASGFSSRPSIKVTNAAKHEAYKSGLDKDVKVAASMYSKVWTIEASGLNKQGKKQVMIMDVTKGGKVQPAMAGPMNSSSAGELASYAPGGSTSLGN